MRVSELFISALRSLWSNKRRSILTMLGIIIGIAAVITILSLGDGVRVETLKNLKATSSGQQSTEIHYNSTNIDFTNSGFNNNDVNKVLESNQVVKVKIQADDNGFINGEGTINGKNVMGEIYLTTKPNQKRLLAGRGINKEDLLGHSPVVLVGKKIAKRGYQSVANALNAGIELNGINYTIVGVIDEDQMDEGRDEHYYSMVAPRQVYLNNGANVPKNTMKITFVKGADVSRETNRIVEKLNSSGSQRNNGNYNFMDMGDMLKGVGDAINSITYFVVAIASISLFIAGIGVMNMMYISVSERTQEIGIRMAVGATQRQILWQFLIEAIILTLMGGMIGYLGGIGLAQVISSFLPFKAIVTFTTFLLAFGTSTIIGLIFGILPAKTASNKNLIEILR